MKKAVQHFPKHNPLSKIRKWIIAFMLIVPLGLSAQIRDSVTTSPPLTDNNGQSGISFNVSASSAIRIVEIMNDFNTTASSYTIWYNTDSINGAPTISTTNGWVAYQTGTITPTGGLVGMQLSTPLDIPAGETYGFFIETETRYHTNTSTDPTVFTDGKLTINTGSSVGYGGGAPNPTFHVRQFLGTIIYEDAIYAFNDAAVFSVDSPKNFCAGMQDIYATIGNYGFNQLDSVEVHWEFNGTSQPSINYTQLLDTVNGTGQYKDMIFLGSAMFNNGVANTIKVWTSSPNGGTDTTNFNDTLIVVRQASLSGYYTIDSSLSTGGSNFQSFSELSEALTKYGMCDTVFVDVAPNTYNDNLYLTKINGLNANSPLYINGQDPTTSILTHDGSSTYATVSLDGVSHVTIKNLGIENSSTSNGAAMVIGSNSLYNTIDSNILKVDVTSTSGAVTNLIFSGNTSNYYTTTTNSSFNTISNNKLEGGYYGMRIYGSNVGIGVNNKILNNDISQSYYYGIYSFYQDSLEIIGNTINMLGRGNNNSYASSSYYVSNPIISRNNIQAGYAGIYFYAYSYYATPTRKVEISNNMIVSKNYGIYTYYLDSANIYHNSVSALGSEAAAYLVSYRSPNMTKWDFRNNILSANTGEALYTNDPDTMFEKLDNNLYNTNGTTLLYIENTSYSDLASYQTANPLFNTSSLEGNPQFFDEEEDLHIVGSFVNDEGDASVGITVDIDGDTRPMPFAASVDIGADEFDTLTCPPVFDIMSYNPTLDSITLTWDGNAGPFEYEIVTEGSAQGSGTSAFTNFDSLRVGGLSPATGYDVYVREACSRGDTSFWRGPFTFYTASEIAFFEDFETFPAGGLSRGWTSSTSSYPMWKADKTAISAYNYAYGGPVEDHTIGSGGTFSYLSYDYFAGTSSLISPPIWVGNNTHLEFSFWYHMNGTDVGDLNVYVDTNGVSNFLTTISGQQQLAQTDPWLEFSTYLIGYEGKYINLRFEASKPNGYYSVIAVDDVELDTIPPLDAGVVSLISPSSVVCAGSFNPIVGVKNIGRADIDSIQVFWDVNGTVDSLMYSTTITSGDTAAVTLGSIAFTSTGVYDVKFYTKNPNSTADPIASNDTLSFEDMRTGLRGTYTIDPSSAASNTNFLSFVDAVEALSNYGVCGPTVINASAGTYSGALHLDNVGGTSSSNTVVFDGGDSSTTIITHDGSVMFSTLTFEKTDYVTFKNVTIENTNTSEAATVLFNESDHITISNTELLVDTNSTNYYMSNVVFSGSNATRTSNSKSDFVTIAESKIKGGYFGVYMYGLNTDVTVGNRFINNDITRQYYYGVYAMYQDSLELIGNTVKDHASQYSYGLMIYYSTNTIIRANEVIAGYYGLYYYNGATYSTKTRNIELTNNMIISTYTYGYGALMYYVESADILHNSFSANGQYAGMQLYYGTMTDYDVRNNIFSSNTGYAFSTNHALTMFSDFDYNVFYTTGTNLLNLNSTTYTDLASFQAGGTGFNNNSLEGDPQFISPSSDLHINGYLPNDAGDNSALISEDIDGDDRPMPGSTTVDIGADEFDPPLYADISMEALLAPMSIGSDSCYSSAQDVEVLIRNVGTQDIDFSIDSINVSVDVSGAATQAYSVWVNDNSYLGGLLGKGDSIIVNLGTLDMTGVGSYNFESYFTSRDTLPLNDTLSSSVVNATAGGTLSGTDTLCGTGFANFSTSGATGELQWQRWDATGSFVNETGADSSSYEVFIDSTTTFRVVACGSEYSDTITVVVIDIPLAPVTSNDSVSSMCGVSGDALLTAASGASAGQFNWYDAPTAGTLIGSGDTLLYPFSSNTTDPASTYSDTVYVSEVNMGCEGPRAMAIATITIEKPMAPSTVTDSAIVFCGDSGTAVLSASSANSSDSFVWYDSDNAGNLLSSADTFYFGLSTAQQSVTTTYTDTFYVAAVDSATACESERSMVTGTVICTVGEDEMPSALSGITIQPNPSKGVFQLIGNNVEEVLDVTIYNANGKAVYHMDAKVSNNFNEQIDLSGLSKGMYFIKFQGDKSMEMRKVVIH